MDIEVRLARTAERLVVRHMMELYQHDFSEFDGTDLDEHGQYGYYDLDCFWINPNFSAFVIKVDDKWAGFVLVNDEVLHPENSATIVEFFVLRKYRRHGVGRHAAQAILSAHPGRWEIKVIPENPAAFSFWQNIIKASWPGQEHAVTMNDDHWRGPVFTAATDSNACGEEMDSTGHYEMIGKHIYRYWRVGVQLANLLSVLNPKAEVGRREDDTELLISRIAAELDNRESEIKRQFSEVAAEIIVLRNERDRNMRAGHVPDAQKTSDFVAKSTDVIAQLATLQASLAKQL